MDWIWVGLVKREIEEAISKMSSMATEEAYGIRVVGSPKFGVYSTDFGWGVTPRLPSSSSKLANEVLFILQNFFTKFSCNFFFLKHVIIIII